MRGEDSERAEKGEGMKLGILCIPLLFLPVWAAADSARSLVQEGNAAYEQGKFEDALKAYEKAETSAPDASEILFNKGAVYYQQKDYDKAMEAFEQAGMKTKDAKLEAKSQFNMGNCTFHKAESLMQEKPEDALKALAKSVRYFQHAAELDPAMHEAKQNVEVTRLAIHTIQEAMKAQEEAAKQQQELKEKLEKLIQDQQQLQTLTRQTAEQLAAAPPIPEPAPAPEPSQPEGENTVTVPPTPQQSQAEGESPATPAPPEAPCKGLADVQQTLKTDAQAISGAMAQYVPPPPQSQNITPPLRPPDPEGEQQASPIAEAKDHVDQAAHYQGMAEQQLRESKAGDAQSQQGVAVEELKKALDLLNNSQNQDQKKQDQKQDQQQGEQKQDKQDQQQSQEGEQEQQQPREQQQEGEQQQAQSQQEGESQEQQAQQMQQEGENEGEGEGQDETAREILNEEKEHKMMLMQPPGGYKPVDKDW